MVAQKWKQQRNLSVQGIEPAQETKQSRPLMRGPHCKRVGHASAAMQTAPKFGLRLQRLIAIDGAVNDRPVGNPKKKV
jgi:hypothetical protein